MEYISQAITNFILKKHFMRMTAIENKPADTSYKENYPNLSSKTEALYKNTIEGIVNNTCNNLEDLSSTLRFETEFLDDNQKNEILVISQSIDCLYDPTKSVGKLSEDYLSVISFLKKHNNSRIPLKYRKEIFVNALKNGLISKNDAKKINNGSSKLKSFSDTLMDSLEEILEKNKKNEYIRVASLERLKSINYKSNFSAQKSLIENALINLQSITNKNTTKLIEIKELLNTLLGKGMLNKEDLPDILKKDIYDTNELNTKDKRIVSNYIKNILPKTLDSLYKRIDVLDKNSKNSRIEVTAYKHAYCIGDTKENKDYTIEDNNSSYKDIKEGVSDYINPNGQESRYNILKNYKLGTEVLSEGGLPISVSKEFIRDIKNNTEVLSDTETLRIVLSDKILCKIEEGYENINEVFKIVFSEILKGDSSVLIEGKKSIYNIIDIILNPNNIEDKEYNIDNESDLVSLYHDLIIPNVDKIMNKLNQNAKISMENLLSEANEKEITKFVSNFDKYIDEEITKWDLMFDNIKGKTHKIVSFISSITESKWGKVAVVGSLILLLSMSNLSAQELDDKEEETDTKDNSKAGAPEFFSRAAPPNNSTPDIEAGAVDDDGDIATKSPVIDPDIDNNYYNIATKDHVIDPNLVYPAGPTFFAKAIQESDNHPYIKANAIDNYGDIATKSPVIDPDIDNNYYNIATKDHVIDPNLVYPAGPTFFAKAIQESDNHPYIKANAIDNYGDIATKSPVIDPDIDNNYYNIATKDHVIDPNLVYPAGPTFFAKAIQESDNHPYIKANAIDNYGDIATKNPVIDPDIDNNYYNIATKDHVIDPNLVYPTTPTLLAKADTRPNLPPENVIVDADKKPPSIPTFIANADTKTDNLPPKNVVVNVDDPSRYDDSQKTNNQPKENTDLNKVEQEIKEKHDLDQIEAKTKTFVKNTNQVEKNIEKSDILVIDVKNTDPDKPKEENIITHSKRIEVNADDNKEEFELIQKKFGVSKDKTKTEELLETGKTKENYMQEETESLRRSDTRDPAKDDKEIKEEEILMTEKSKNQYGQEELEYLRKNNSEENDGIKQSNSTKTKEGNNRSMMEEEIGMFEDMERNSDNKDFMAKE